MGDRKNTKSKSEEKALLYRAGAQTQEHSVRWITTLPAAFWRQKAAKY